MEVPLSPLEFARRTRRLYAGQEAVVDEELRLTYGEFFDRCDRWSSVLQGLGVAQGDRVATIAPNTHAQLEAFYAVPQIGAVLVPINYRLTADDFAYVIEHSGSRVVCAHSDYLDAVDSIRDRLPGVEHYVAMEGGPREGWIDYEQAVAAAEPSFDRPSIDEGDLISINYTSGTTARPKGVMITHRNAALNVIGTLLHLPIRHGGALPVDAPDVPRERMDVHLDRHGGRRNAHLPAQGRARTGLRADSPRGRGVALRRADGADRARQRACGRPRARFAPGCTS